jgi:hypothetical protein
MQYYIFSAGIDHHLLMPDMALSGPHTTLKEARIARVTFEKDADEAAVPGPVIVERDESTSCWTILQDNVTYILTCVDTDLVIFGVTDDPDIALEIVKEQARHDDAFDAIHEALEGREFEISTVKSDGMFWWRDGDGGLGNTWKNSDALMAAITDGPTINCEVDDEDSNE